MIAGNQNHLVHWAKAEHFFGQIQMPVVDGIEAPTQDCESTFEKFCVWHITQTFGLAFAIILMQMQKC